VAKVLLMDKQAHMLDLLRSKFELEGFEVLSAVSAEEGLELAEREQPDLIVLDERLQDDGGITVSDRLRDSEAAGEIPVILLTSRASEGGGTAKDGSSSTVQMPFRPSQLLALVRENL
jgi:two-component system alkaline phosphatase synthesis response regulator PhoP